MMRCARNGYMFLNRGLLGASRCAAPPCSSKKSMPTSRDTSAKKQIVKPISPNDRTTKAKAWTAIAWPTNNQSGTPDGKFGPAKQMKGWKDCWFLAALAAVANDPEGRKILVQSMQRVNGGYQVIFTGSPITKVFVADAELQELVKTEGGDADTRLMELAADRFFQLNGNFQDLYIAAFMQNGDTYSKAQRCLQLYCQHFNIQDPIHFNPMRAAGNSHIGFFMLAGMFPAQLKRTRSTALPRSDVMRFLHRFVPNGRAGTSVLFTGLTNPLGAGRHCQEIVLAWDAIRTEITRDQRLREQERAFLNALGQWLETGNSDDLQALRTAAGNLNLVHINLATFVEGLVSMQFDLMQDHFSLLRSAVREVLSGGPGYIGFTGSHYGNIEGINEAAGTFTYSEPYFPTLVHTGELSVLIEAIRSGDVSMTAIEPIPKRDKKKHFEYAGTSRGRHLRQIHDQVVRDGQIDQAESGPLADLLEMDDVTFRQVYDSDKNGAIEGSELKAVKLRVDRRVDHLELTPIW